MKAALVIVAVLLAGCGSDDQHAQLLERGCTFKSRGVVGRFCNRGACSDLRGTIYSCPAYEAKVVD